MIFNNYNLFLMFGLVQLSQSRYLKIPKSLNISFEDRAREDVYNTTSPRDNPHAVMVVRKSSGEYRSSTCSGSLLTCRWVLTAAHCLYGLPDPSLVLVYAGGNSLEELVSGDLPGGAQVARGQDLLIHPGYRKGIALEYDLGLVQVPGFRLTEAINTIQLSTQPWKFQECTDCKFTGYGRVQRNSTHSLDYRRKTQQLRILKPCPCEKVMQGSYKGNVETFVCSKPEEDFGLCRGDSGGGLVCNGSLAGVATFITSVKDFVSCKLQLQQDLVCGSNRTMSVFTALRDFREWLTLQVPLNISATSETSDGASSRAQLKFSTFVLIYATIQLLFY